MNAVKLKFKIDSLESAPSELQVQLPISGKIIRKIPGNDRPDYYLAKLDKTLIWTCDENNKHEISNVVVCSRYKGQNLSPQMKDHAIALAYVIDDSLLEDRILKFKKIKYMAKGLASATSKSIRRLVKVKR